MKKHRKTFLIMAILSTVIFCLWSGVRIVKVVKFNLECTSYIKRASDANTVEIAKVELAKVIKYAEDNELTEGVVSIFLKNPSNDIGFWYQNIKSAYQELDNLSDDASALEKTNVLMKLRESLTDRTSENGSEFIIPMSMEIYPNNVLYFWWGMISSVAMATFWTLFLCTLPENIKKKIIKIK